MKTINKTIQPYLLLCGVFALVYSCNVVSACEAAQIRIYAPRKYHPQLSLPIRVELQNADGEVCHLPWDSEAVVTVTGEGSGVTPGTFHLYNGAGSALLDLQGEGNIMLKVSVGEISAEIVLERLEWVEHEVSQDITGTETWGPGDGIVHVKETIEIPAGAELKIDPGTFVIIDPKKSINVSGKISSLGNLENPVYIGPSGTDPWGEIQHDGSDDSRYLFTFFLGGGDSPGLGHTGHGPVVKITNSDVELSSCTFMDNYGKCMWGDKGANIALYDCLLTRSPQGMEVTGITLSVDSCFYLEFTGPDDNDGLYMHHGGDMTVSNSVFAVGDDDGIDTLDASPSIYNCIVRDYADKCVTLFHGTTTIRNCVLADSDKGVSAKGDGAVVDIENCTLFGNHISFQTRIKDGSPDDDVRLDVKNSIAWGADIGVDTEYSLEKMNINISYSDVGDGFSPYPGLDVFPGEGNLNADPLFVDEDGYDLSIQAGSPCIDSGDPASPMDPDQTRKDMGAFYFLHSSNLVYFKRGDVNGDDSLDISDAISLLLYLFSGSDIFCEDAADVSDNGGLDIGDAIYLLTYLFSDGTSLPEPFLQCGTDNTEDDLGCETFSPCGQ